MTPTTIIALALGVFFLLVALGNRIRSIREHRRLADIRSAALNGGTPESPVHLESPFTPRVPDAQPGAPVQQPAAPAPSVPQPTAQPAAPMPQPAQTAPVAQAAVPPAPPAAPAAASAATAPKNDYEWE